MSSIPDPATTPWIPLWDTGAGGSGGAGSIPGEMKVWSGIALPDIKYGKWVWADGTAYSVATYPEAAANIAPAWKTAYGAVDPGAGQFRVPDMRGVTPVGMDAMPGGARANRVTRSVAITIAKNTGEEYHTITTPELPPHAHPAGGLVVNNHDHGTYTGYVTADHAHVVPDHSHPIGVSWNEGSPGVFGGAINNYGVSTAGSGAFWTGGIGTNHQHQVGAQAPGVAGSTGDAGSGGTHENMPPAVFVPWIVRLDG